MKWRRRIVLGVVFAFITIFGIRVLDDIIRIDWCPVYCQEYRDGKLTWWEAFWRGCICGDEPTTPPKTDGVQRPATMKR